MSSSDRTDPWRRFARIFLVTAGALLALIYGFTVTVDPWDALPLSPDLPRVPNSSNARYAFPMLARSQRFDSAIVGSSVARLLRPTDLDPGFGARFVNLSMNAATAYEQSRILQLFLRAHPHPRVVVIAIDLAWCTDRFERFTPRPFPEWMYRDDRWPGYLEMLSPYALQEAWNQFAVMVGLKRRRYGLDGYTRFVPPDDQYDPVRRDRQFATWPPLDHTPAPPPGTVAALPNLPLLDALLSRIPDETRTILFFPPYHIDQQGAPGSATAWRWAACKTEVTRIAQAHAALALDFMIPSTISGTRDNYWDPYHYRVGIAARLAAALIDGASPDAVVLTAPDRAPRPAARR